jgi:hypothetical protein
MLSPILTLLELARDPQRVGDVPRSAVPSLMAQVAALQVALAARLASNPDLSEARSVTTNPEAEHLLTPQEAAASLGVTVTWLYRHASTLPFTRRLSRKALRFSETGLQRWLAGRKP